jgi:hypothetical protein
MHLPVVFKYSFSVTYVFNGRQFSLLFCSQSNCQMEVDGIRHQESVTPFISNYWNMIKNSLAPSISLESYSRTDRGRSFNMVSDVGGFEFEPQPHIFHYT